MLTLAVECATKTVGLALLDEEEVRAELYLRLERHHAEVLLPALEHLFMLAGVKTQQVDLLACTVGPGSFTGLRIGVSTVKGLALAMGRPIVGVSTLEVLAMNALTFPHLICPMLDARKKQVYTGLYRVGPDTLPEVVQEDCLTDVAVFLQGLDQDRILFLGDGAVSYEKQILEILGPKAILCDRGGHKLLASATGLIGLRHFRKGNLLDALSFVPRYLRLSEAETNCAI